MFHLTASLSLIAQGKQEGQSEAVFSADKGVAQSTLNTLGGEYWGGGVNRGTLNTVGGEYWGT